MFLYILVGMHVIPMNAIIKKGRKAYASVMIPNTYHIYIFY